MLAHLDRLKAVRELLLPDDLEHAVHQNRLLKLAREGSQMTAQHLRDLEPVSYTHLDVYKRQPRGNLRWPQVGEFEVAIRAHDAFDAVIEFTAAMALQLSLIHI